MADNETTTTATVRLDTYKAASLNDKTFTQYARQIANVIPAADYATLMLEELMPAFIAKLVLLEDAVRHPVAYQDTPEITNINVDRDRAFRAFWRAWEAVSSLTYPTVEQFAAIKVLKPIVVRYAGADTGNQQGKTTLYSGLLLDLSKTEAIVADVATLKLADAVAALKALNDKFVALVEARNAEQAERIRLNGGITTQELRGVVAEMLYNVLFRANSCYECMPTATVEAYMTKMKAIINNFKRYESTSSSSSEGGDDTGDDTGDNTGDNTEGGDDAGDEGGDTGGETTSDETTGGEGESESNATSEE